MQDLTPFAATPTMTSREIAELTGKRHADVMRDIRAMISRFEEHNANLHRAKEHDPNLDRDQSADLSLDWHCETEHYIDTNGRAREQYRLDKNTTHCLVAGYDPVPRMRIIQRLEALETGKATQVIGVTPVGPIEQVALTILDCRLRAAALLSVPTHIAQQEAVKAVMAGSGVDYRGFLLAAPAQQNIEDQDEMLEPEDLAQRLGFQDGKALNLAIRDVGFQLKVSGEWLPTEKGAPHCIKHAWTTKFKTGYNLKWRVSVVKAELIKNGCMA